MNDSLMMVDKAIAISIRWSILLLVAQMPPKRTGTIVQSWLSVEQCGDRLNDKMPERSRFKTRLGDSMLKSESIRTSPQPDTTIAQYITRTSCHTIVVDHLSHVQLVHSFSNPLQNSNRREHWSGCNTNVSPH
jgi:hypothetical protein